MDDKLKASMLKGISQSAKVYLKPWGPTGPYVRERMFDARVRYLCNTNKDYAQGYDAAALCLPLDRTRSADWQEGWRQCQRDIDYQPPTP